MAELLGVELARPGTWDLAIGGKTEFSVDMLRDAAAFYEDTGRQPVPVGLGHTDDRFTDPDRIHQDGDPAFGLVTNVRYAEDEPGHDPGPVLLGDVVEVPDWLHASAPTRWPNRSIEAVADFTFNGRKYAMALTRLAFLGSTPPAMQNLRSLHDLQRALAAAQRIAASAPVPAPTTPAKAEDAPPPMEGAGMSLAKYREVLAGLPDGASEEDIRAALAAAGMSAPEPAQPADPPQPVPAQPDPQPAGDPQGDQNSDADASGDLDKKIAAAAKRGGVVTIDAAQLAQFQDGVRKAAGLAKQLEQRERDEAITEAITAGKFPPARRPHYEKLWDADPEGTKTLMASLAAGLVPVTATGYSGEGADALWDAEYRSLFPPTATGGR